MSYASATTVSVEKSRAEIDTLLGKHKASHRGIQVNEELGLAQIAFVIQGRKYRLDVPLPKQDKMQLQRKHEQECRSRWRAILLMLRAKLELVEIGVSTVEREFLADMVLANGETMHLAVANAIKAGLDTGKAPILSLPEGT
jgi:tRNA nucleotidyltransferase/poly(A) polymerase